MADLTSPPVTAGTPAADGVTVTVALPLPGTGNGQWAISFVVIHEADRFDPAIPARSYPLAFAADTWTGTVTIAPEPGTSFGLSGRYLYRFSLSRADGTVVVPWFTDPFARATDDVGQLAAFDTADTITGFGWTDDAWKVPGADDLVVYELQVEEFNGTFAGVAARLPYLRSLGVNCLELMPVTTLRLTFDYVHAVTAHWLTEYHVDGFRYDEVTAAPPPT